LIGLVFLLVCFLNIFWLEIKHW
jgi:hypothetical protein